MAREPGNFSRRIVIRTILMRCFTVAEPVVFLTLLAMIFALKGSDDFSCDIIDIQLKGTLDGIATALSQTEDGKLDVPMEYEEAVSLYYQVPWNLDCSVLVKNNTHLVESCFGPEYVSDNAGDGPQTDRHLSGWGARKHSRLSGGKGWATVLSTDYHSSGDYRGILLASFSTLQAQAMESCHAPSTLRSYGSGWNSWVRYCEFFNRSTLCIDFLGSPMAFLDVIHQIQNYIHFECAIRQVQPNTIKDVYLAGISDYYDRCGILNDFRKASNHNSVQLVLCSYCRSWSKKHPDSSKVKIPKTCNLI